MSCTGSCALFNRSFLFSFADAELAPVGCARFHLCWSSLSIHMRSWGAGAEVRISPLFVRTIADSRHAEILTLHLD